MTATPSPAAATKAREAAVYPAVGRSAVLSRLLRAHRDYEETIDWFTEERSTERGSLDLTAMERRSPSWRCGVDRCSGRCATRCVAA